MGFTPGEVAAAMPVSASTQARKMEDITRWMRELPPSVVASFKPLMDDLWIRVQDAINSASYTRDEIDSKVAGAVANPGPIAPTTVTASGDISTPGAITAGGVVTFDAGINSADVHGRILSTGYDAVYVGDGNRLGISPSARRFKQDIQPAVFDSSKIDLIEPVQFRLKGAVAQLGDAAKVEVGFIAEQLEEIGYGKFVSYDDTGQTTGIAYERLCVPLVAGLQDAFAQIRDLTARLDAAGL